MRILCRPADDGCHVRLETQEETEQFVRCFLYALRLNQGHA